ncbi:hypothetical protein BJY00DRAFT_319622 [Aspergillus carlsbadensis]|nr:hypothetical protein BJY00DRAFT_319622 [Aspergillus carlsbadensis]
MSLEDDSGAESEDEMLPAIQAYKEIIQTAPAYTKLLADLRREIILAPPDVNIRDEVHGKVMTMLPRSRKMSRRCPPESFSMTFDVDWDPLAFVQEQEYKDSPGISIANAIVLTGTIATAQAMTCLEYLQQTWPSIGKDILKLIQDALRPPHSAVTCGSSPSITISLVQGMPGTPRYLEVAVSGHASWIAEVGEILAWLGSAMRSSTSLDEVVCCRPLVDQIPTAAAAPVNEYRCKISYATHSQTRSQMPSSGECWHNLFRAPVIATGYPIARRPAASPGLEIPLAMMSVLTETQRLNCFGGRYFIKGFSTMLVPTHYEENIIMWHLVHNSTGERIPYTDGNKMGQVEVPISRFETARHILGWCSQMKLYAGAKDAAYNVQNSWLPGVPETSPLANVSISMGRIITGGASYSLGRKDVPVHVTRNGYARKLKWISKKFVLLWDKADKRGWLINGTSALLHLVRTALERDRTSELSSLIDLDPSTLQYRHMYRADSATSVLSNKANMMRNMYDADDPPTSFQDYVTGFYNLQEIIIDHQSHWKGTSSQCPSRSHLEGWDFDDLASERDPIYPRVAPPDTTRSSWTQLTRSVNAITLFGCNFGDIIRPADEPGCPKFSSLPSGQYYLAATRADLNEIMIAGRGCPSSSPMRLTDSAIWHIPEGLLDLCKCRNNETGDHSDIAQILLPSTMAYRLLGKVLSLGCQQGGAVIFGFNSEHPWHWTDSGEPSQSPQQTIDRACPQRLASPSRDSGIGKSMSSSSDPGEDSAVGMCSSYDKPDDPPDHLTETRQESQSQHAGVPSYRTTRDYAVGIICALHKEFKAIRMLFDETHDNVAVSHCDPNYYAFGSIANHNIVATCLPDGEYGTNSAADVAANMKRSFTRLSFCLLVGIGGGVPGQYDIRLGDVVVSTPRGASVGVLPYDTLKTLSDGITQINGLTQGLKKEPLAGYMQQIAELDNEYQYPGVEHDSLFVSDYAHPLLHPSGTDTCKGCDTTKVKPRPPRDSIQPQIHYGLIASGNQVMKNALTRDTLGTQYDIMCFEMEAAGIMNILPSLVVRGICDYCDSHKNKRWQKYAAASAAAFAKLLLSRVRPEVEGLHFQQPLAHTPFKSHHLEYGKRVLPIGDGNLQDPMIKRRRILEEG